VTRDTSKGRPATEVVGGGRTPPVSFSLRRTPRSPQSMVRIFGVIMALMVGFPGPVLTHPADEPRGQMVLEVDGGRLRGELVLPGLALPSPPPPAPFGPEDILQRSRDVMSRYLRSRVQILVDSEASILDVKSVTSIRRSKGTSEWLDLQFDCGTCESPRSISVVVDFDALWKLDIAENLQLLLEVDVPSGRRLVTLDPAHTRFDWDARQSIDPILVTGPSSAGGAEGNPRALPAVVLPALLLAAFTLLAAVSIHRQRGPHSVWRSESYITVTTMALIWMHAMWPRDSGGLPGVDRSSLAARLLENSYRALGARTESGIYDSLASSVDGPLLERLYLEMYRGLFDARAGTVSTSIIDLDIQSVEILNAKRAAEVSFPGSHLDPKRSGVDGAPAGGLVDAFRVRMKWQVSGIERHSRHAHRRLNVYDAEFTIGGVGGFWKLVDCRVLDLERPVQDMDGT